MSPDRISSSAMPESRSHLPQNVLWVAVAIAGLLSMHGIEVAVVSASEQSHAIHGVTGGAADHGALGLCLFVAAIAVLGIAARAQSMRGRAYGRRSDIHRTMPFGSARGIAGRSRLTRLGVLRV